MKNTCQISDICKSQQQICLNRYPVLVINIYFLLISRKHRYRNLWIMIVDQKLIIFVQYTAFYVSYFCFRPNYSNCFSHICFYSQIFHYNFEIFFKYFVLKKKFCFEYLDSKYLSNALQHIVNIIYLYESWFVFIENSPARNVFNSTVSV